MPTATPSPTRAAAAVRPRTTAKVSPAKATTKAKASAPAAEDLADGTVYLRAVRLNRIHPSPDNMRTELPELDKLADNIREQGVLEAVVVAPQNGADPRDPRTHFDLVFGHRRYAAAGMAGLKTIPAIVNPALVGPKADEARLVENLQREGLTVLEEARSYERLIRVHGYRQVDVAKAAGFNQGHVSKTLRLLRLPKDVQNAIDRGQIGKNDAVELSRLPAEAVPRAFKDIMRGEDPQVAIRTAASWAEREAERQGAIKTLQKQGVHVDIADGPVKWDLATGPVPLHYMPWVDAKAHAKLPCHAAIVGPVPRYTEDEVTSAVQRWATIVCTTPSNHPHEEETDPEEAAKIAAAQAAARERQERREAFNSATAARQEFIARLISGKTRMAKTAALEHLARVAVLEALIAPAYSPTDEAFTLAGIWLGADDAEDIQAELTMRALDGKSDMLAKTALAVRLAVDELAMVDDSPDRWANVHGPLLVEHLHFLAMMGNQPAQIETDWVAAYSDLESYMEDDDTPDV